MQRISYCSLIVLLLFVGCHSAPKTVSITAPNGLAGILSSYMQQRQLGLYALKSAHARVDLADHPVLVMSLPDATPMSQYAPDLDEDIAFSVVSRVDNAFGGYESYTIASNIKCPGDNPCVSQTSKLSVAPVAMSMNTGEISAAGEQKPIAVSKKIFGSGTSRKRILEFSIQRLREENAVLLAYRNDAAAFSDDLVELTIH